MKNTFLNNQQGMINTSLENTRDEEHFP